MKLQQILRARIAALAFVVLPPGLVYAQSGVTAYKVEQVNPPFIGLQLVSANGLNNKGAVVGESGGCGFKLKDGNYTPIYSPESGSCSEPMSINDYGTIAGSFIGNDSFQHGFFFSKNKYTQYDVELGVLSTRINGVNNSGNFTGAVNDQHGGHGQGFVNIGGAVTTFYASGTDQTEATGINNSDEVVGYFTPDSSVYHCFYRDVSGAITQIDYPGATSTYCYGINDSGMISGSYVDASNNSHGFLDSAGVFTQLPLQFTRGINNAGDIVGSYAGPGNNPNGPNFYGFLAKPKTLASYANVQVPGAQSTSIFDINGKAMVGQYTDGSGVAHGLRYAQGKVTNIDDPNAQPGTTMAEGINSTGQIVGAYTNGSGTSVGFLYSNGAYTDVVPPGSGFTIAFGINDSGVIVGAYVDSSKVTHGFSFDGSTYTTIDPSGSSSTIAVGINAAGNITVQWIDFRGFTESSLYDGTTFTSIDVPCATGTDAHHINTAGNIAFSWTDYDGNLHGAVFIAGSYYVFDVPPSLGAGTRADGINDSNLIVGRFVPTGTTVYEGFKGTL